MEDFELFFVFQVLRNKSRVNSATLSSNQRRGSPQSKHFPDTKNIAAIFAV